MSSKVNYAVFASGGGSIFECLATANKRGELPGELTLLVSDTPNANALKIAEENVVPTELFLPDQYQSKIAFEQDIVNCLENYHVDYVVLCGFMRVLSPYFIQNFPERIINTHPSLLPAFKGRDAVKDAYQYGVKVTGCTVHFVNEDIDGGPILLQEEVHVSEKDTVERLRSKIKDKEKSLIIKAVTALVQQNIVKQGMHRWVISNDKTNQ